MTDTDIDISLEASKARAVAALSIWQETVDPCDKGHVEHGPEAHLGRRLAHSMVGTMGADWDEASVLSFIERADKVSKAKKGTMAYLLRHSLLVHADGHWVAFQTIEDENR